MNEIFKKFNVFDYFSHLVPGAIVVLALLSYEKGHDIPLSSLCGNLSEEVKNNDIVIWTIFLVASHCMGLVNNVISDVVWYGFRNNTILIGIAEKHTKHNSLSICENLLFIAVSITLALILFIVPRTTINKIVHWFKENCAKMKRIAWFGKICDKMESIVLWLKENCAKMKSIAWFGKNCAKMKNIILWFISPCKTIEDYYKKYEEVKVHYPSNNISNLEAQIAFLRNSILPLFLLSLICIDKSNPNILLIVSPFIAFAAFFLHQQKLYFHVYELCHIIDLKGMKLKLLVLAKVKAGDDKTNVCNSFSQILDNKNCTEMCSGDLDGKKVGVVSFTDISNASFDTLKEKIEIYKDAKALVVTCQEEKVDLYEQIKKYAEKNSFELKEAASFEEIEPKIREFFNK